MDMRLTFVLVLVLYLSPNVWTFGGRGVATGKLDMNIVFLTMV